jgi:diketogulonate reductase-like aldo/keto reductase
MALTLRSTFKMHHGVEIPLFGLGVFRSEPGAEAEGAVAEALRQGYRLIDTARVYGNEQDVGRAVRGSGIPRSEIFITTKLWNADHGYDRALRAFDESLQRLGMEQVDLYLIHWPVERLRKDSWKAMERLHKEGRARSIGVSNYTVRHLQELIDSAEIVPHANQVEYSPFLYQRELRDFCRKHRIALEAYSPLTKGAKLGHPVVKEIGQAHGKTGAQVLIRWVLQQDVVCIPKSVRPERIRENAAVFDFELSSAEMERLDGLNENFRTSWDPTNVP